MGDLDLKSEGLLALAGEKMTHRFDTASFLNSGALPPDDAIFLLASSLFFTFQDLSHLQVSPHQAVTH